VDRRAALTRAADDSANAGRALGESFDVQERQSAPAYDYFVCRSCKMAWFLPKDPARRTALALGILADHASSHERAR
jgi:hypothetical protein